MKHNWLNRTEYPFTSRYVEFDNVRQHYIDEGVGEVLLFIHGTPSWSFDFRMVIKELSKSYRCVAIDHVGFGLSDKPSEYDYSTPIHAGRLDKFIEHLHLSNITLVVHDFGGPIGFSVAEKSPEKIKRIVVLNSWLWSSEADPDFKKVKRILKSPLVPFLYKYLNFSPRFILPSSFGTKKLKKNIHNQYTAPFSNLAERKGTLAFAYSLLSDQSWFEELWQNIHVLSEKPSLFIWGMKDPVIKSHYLHKFMAAFENPTVVRLETCGHFPQEEEPEATVMAILNFLKTS